MSSHKLPSEYPKENELSAVYETLGLKESSTLVEIKNSYKNLIKLLHPDKPLTLAAKQAGWTLEEKNRAFIEVQEAYEYLIKLHAYETNYPDVNIDYEIDSNFVVHNSTSLDPGNYNQDTFNKYFNEKKQQDLLNGFEDPYSKGYDMFNSGANNAESDDYKRIKSGMGRAEISVEVNPKLVQRDLHNGELTKHQYFADFNCQSNGSFNATELGKSSISDYSLTISKGTVPCTYGSDLMAVYGTNHEPWEDSVRRDTELYNKYSDTTRVEKRLSKQINERENTNFNDPLLKNEYQIQKEQMDIMERARLLQYQRELDYVDKKYIGPSIPTRSPPRF
jgi:curved DNA-binding protein CbpA